MAGLDEILRIVAREGDSRSWEHAGLACRMVRHDSLKHWCGYVGVPASHPDHGKSYDAVYEGDRSIEVHGGLTYAEDHAPKEVADGLWWFGFDCAHSGDLAPGSLARSSESYLLHSLSNDVYRDADFVERETAKLAEQLASPAPQATA